jgi:hypothetical protein
MFRKMLERKTKRQSGAFYHKRNNERDMEREKLCGSMLKYLKMDEDEPTISTTTVSSQFNSNSKNEFETETSHESHQPEVHLDEETVPCASDIESSGNEDNTVDTSLEITTDFDTEDPYCWPTIINNCTIEIIIQVGPVTVENMKFPTDNSGRLFSVSQYMTVSPNGENI